MNYMIPYNIKTRFFGGRLLNQLIALKNLNLKYKKSDLAKYIYKLLRKKYWLGKKSIEYSDIVEIVWNKLIFENNNTGEINLRGIRFVNDNALISEYTEIFLCDFFEDFSMFEGEKLIAAQLLPLFTKDGPYQYEKVLLKSGDIVVDAGANIGVFSIFAISKGVDKVYAFEPEKNALQLLEKNIDLNNSNDNISIQPFGLSDRTQDEELISDPLTGHIAASIIRPKLINTLSEVIQCITLDEWVRENKVDRIDFIKADIEGAERKMLQGATNVLKVFAPRLAICTYHLDDDPEVLEKIIIDANPKYKIKHFGNKLFATV